ncbi:putative protein kinase RLK-Pelle-CrRLK1L-1 family [Helianthus debilis subsp. tardiflorus]
MSLLKDFAHLQIPLDDIISGTDNFSDQNLIREGGFGRIYKGKLFLSGETTDIVVRRLDPKYGQGNKELLTGISILSSLKHPNLVTFIGFCDEKEEKIIINKYEVNSSLDKYLSDPSLTWTRRLNICVRVARALSYIYNDAGRDFSIIHRNIKSSKILLDHNWEPKLYGFEHSVKNPASRRQRPLVTDLSGTYGYVDPACQKNRSVTHKSDMFSFGVVLFEILCGRRAFITGEFEDQSLMFTMKNLEEQDKVPKDRLLSHLAKSHYKKGKLDDMINPALRNQMEKGSYKIFSKTAYDCLKEERVNRPDIDQVLQRLEKALRRQQEYDHKRSKDVAEIEEDKSYNYPQVTKNK